DGSSHSGPSQTAVSLKSASSVIPSFTERDPAADGPCPSGTSVSGTTRSLNSAIIRTPSFLLASSFMASPQPERTLFELVVIVPELHGIPSRPGKQAALQAENDPNGLQRRMTREVNGSRRRSEQQLLRFAVRVGDPDLSDPVALTLRKHEVDADHFPQDGKRR